MNHKLLTMLFAVLMTGGICLAQTDQPAILEDFKPNSTNQPGKQYPQVNSEGCVHAQISAPDAKEVLLDIGAVKYPMTKDDNGVWTGDSKPQDEGFHYYQIWIDGAAVPDPGTLFFYGASRWGSGIEIPAKDQDFYAVKNVPHGQLRENHYFSKTCNAVRRCFVYTPPKYDQDLTKHYPVLYLQHGMGEDETGWGNQGHANLILDNLIAAGKATPFIIVMENGSINFGGSPRSGRGMGARGAGTPGSAAPARDPNQPRAAQRGRMGGPGGFNFAGQFERILIDDLIPYIESNYRTLTDQPHRAMAGLSMGGMQTRSITLANLDRFSHIGIFSGGSISPDDVNNAEDFKDKVKLVFVSYGSRELENRRAGGRGGFGGDPKANSDALKEAGINSHFYVSPQTAHEWQSWRRGLREFAPLLFRDNAFSSSTQAVTAKKFVLRVDCGATDPYKDKSGNIWAADQESGTGKDWGAVYGMTMDRTGIGVTGTDNPTIYETERYSMESYKFTVPNGKYAVRLHFAEAYDGIMGPGGRVFSVSVPGQEMLKDLDVFKTVGSLKPLIKEYKGVSVESGQLVIGFTSNIENPQICGIEILAE